MFLTVSTRLRLALHGLGHLVALVAGAGKLLRGRNVEHRIPVHARIELGRGSRRRRRRCLEVDLLARTRIRLRRILQAIAANPDLVVRVWQIGNDEATLIVRHDDFCKFGRKILCLGNDPDTRFGALVADHLPANVMRGYIDSRGDCGTAQQQRSRADTACEDSLAVSCFLPFAVFLVSCALITPISTNPSWRLTPERILVHFTVSPARKRPSASPKRFRARHQVRRNALAGPASREWPRFWFPLKHFAAPFSAAPLWLLHSTPATRLTLH